MRTDIKRRMNFIGGALLIFLAVENIAVALLFAFEDYVLPRLSLGAYAEDVLCELLMGASYVISYTLTHFICKKLLASSYLPPKFEKKLGDHPVAMSFAALGAIMLTARVIASFAFGGSSEITPYHGENIVLQMFVTVLVPAFCEELMFRGLILTNLLPFGRRFAVIASGLIFGLIHGNHDQMLFAAIAGVILGLLYVETGSIWCGVLVHMFNNFVSLVETVLSFNLRLCFILEMIPIILGAISAVFLIRVGKEKKRLEPLNGEFGGLSPRFTCALKGFSARDAVKSFFTPTMLCFYIYVIVNEVLYVLLF